MVDTDAVVVEKKQSKSWVIILVLVFVILGGFGWWLYQNLATFQRGGSVVLDNENIGQNNANKVVPPAPVNLGIKILDQARLDSLLTAWGLENQTSWPVPKGPILTGKVNTIKIEVTAEPQLYNREDTASGPVGSVNVIIADGTMLVKVQTVPKVWNEIDRDWHVEAQLIRLLNDMAPRTNQRDPGEYLDEYAKQPRMVQLYEI